MDNITLLRRKSGSSTNKEFRSVKKTSFDDVISDLIGLDHLIF